MNKRKRDTETEGSCSPSELKKVLVETDSEISRTETLCDINVEDVECEETDEIDGQDEKELEMRDKLLEELSPGFRQNTFVSDIPKTCHKIIKLKGKLPNLSLPSGWMALKHQSGGIIYLHRESRVCTWARPYHLGDGSVRKHDVPTAAIPCLHQFVALKKFELEGNNRNGYTVPGEGSDGVRNLNDHVFDGNTTEAENSGESENSVNSGESVNNEEHADKHNGILENDIEPVDSNHDNHNVDLDNCDGNLGNHDTHLDKCNDNLKNVGQTSEPTDGDSNHGNHGVDVDTVSKEQVESNGEGTDREGSSNQLFEISLGKVEMITATKLSAYLGKLWEFQEMTAGEVKRPLLSFGLNQDEDDVQGVGSELLKTIPFLIQGCCPVSKARDKYVINTAGKSPQSLLHEYCTKVLKLKPMYKTVESGNSNNPFLATVEIDGLQYGSGTASSKKQARHIAAQGTLDVLMPGTYEKTMHIEQHLKVFDNVSIDDPSVYELTSKLGLMSPNQVLDQCVKRNQGVLSSKVNFEMHHTSDRKIFYSIECGKHKATGPCRNKKIGRELAAQALLKQLHPHLNNWGSLLRIYMDKHTTKEFTKVDDKSLNTASSSVNRELLNDLKHEMWQLLKDKKSNPCPRFTSTKLTDIDI